MSVGAGGQTITAEKTAQGRAPPLSSGNSAYDDPELRPLHLTPNEKQALVAFLGSLSGTILDGVR